VQDAFFALQQLEWLSLAQNIIRKVSTNICEGAKQVLHLNLSDNDIDSNNNPLSFSQCSQLQTLSIAHNHISALPPQAMYGLFNLTYLDLSHNYLTHFGPEVFAVPNISTTQLPTNNSPSPQYQFAVPNTSTTQLRTNNSPCPQYQSLYRQLKVLKLNNNRIRSLDRCVFESTSRLQTVDVAANNLRALDYGMFRSLENCSSFDISWNTLSTVDVPTVQVLLDSGNGTAVNLTGKCCVCV
jgi:Leucine-rich repeat (LRR) protein